jgi:hypothetical protein
MGSSRLRHIFFQPQSVFFISGKNFSGLSGSSRSATADARNESAAAGL